jgi:putative DNA primase/helicase
MNTDFNPPATTAETSIQIYENGKDTPSLPASGNDIEGNSLAQGDTSDDGQSKISEQAEVLPVALSQDELAHTFSRKYGQVFRYIGKWGKWFVFNGSHWEEESTGRVFDLIRKLCRHTAAEAWVHKDDKKSLTNSSNIAGVERLARTDRIHAATENQWDLDGMLLNTPGGIVDLSTGELSPHDPTKYMTKVCSVTPADIPTPEWDKFLKRVQPDPEIRDYLDRLCGYALTGSTREQMLAFFYGTGANGKSLFQSIQLEILASYAITAPIELLVETKNENHPTEIARLRGARTVGLSETKSGRAWSEARIKSLTGGDKQAARFMRQDFFEYIPQFKLFILGNHMPALRNVDEAISRRLQVVRWGVTIPTDERDKELAEKLRPEYPGILFKWIQGCLAWQREGLRPPASVIATTKDYLDGEDKLGIWLGEATVNDVTKHATIAELFASWSDWCISQNELPKTKQDLTKRLVDRGYKKSEKQINNAWCVHGLYLKEKSNSDQSIRKLEREGASESAAAPPAGLPAQLAMAETDHLKEWEARPFIR